MAISGKQGMTKAMKKAQRLQSMGANRKRDKKAQRAHYHQEFKRAPGRRGYPRMKGGGRR